MIVNRRGLAAQDRRQKYQSTCQWPQRSVRAWQVLDSEPCYFRVATKQTYGYQSASPSQQATSQVLHARRAIAAPSQSPARLLKATAASRLLRPQHSPSSPQVPVAKQTQTPAAAAASSVDQSWNQIATSMRPQSFDRGKGVLPWQSQSFTDSFNGDWKVHPFFGLCLLIIDFASGTWSFYK